ncbi:MAG: SPFH domain-containing protein [Clostridiales bacterium]|jgi:regulator of protease activity HflC (stomatin/prohibitin superfamily)|nr:SPFH domain-containing protein [Clostridiales bacterium]
MSRNYQEKTVKTRDGFSFLIGSASLQLASCILLPTIAQIKSPALVAAGVISCVAGIIVSTLGYAGLKIARPNEAYVFTLFGTYCGTLRKPGFYWVNPFASAINPTAKSVVDRLSEGTSRPETKAETSRKNTVSLKTLTLNNDLQKINDKQGNPLIVGIVVVWRVVDTAKAVFNVGNYKEFLSIQCDSALRNIVRLYPYDAGGDIESEKTLRSSGIEIAENLREEIQSKTCAAGLEILEAKITHLSYAPEIASVMLQRQQATAIVSARQMIVDGAVGMVEMALAKLNDNDIVRLDEERKAVMVSNLLLALCANRDVQPVVNSGSLY